MIGDGDAVGVAGEISEYGPGSAERGLGVDAPLDLARRRQIGREGLALGERGMFAEEAERMGSPQAPAFAACRAEAGGVLPRLPRDVAETRPILAPLRRIIPRVGMLDISPIVAILLLQALQQILMSLIRR